jgi:hypothetical protein
MPAERVVLIEFEDAWLEELIPMWRASFEDGVGITDPHPIEDQRKYFMTEVLRHYGVRLAVQDAGSSALLPHPASRSRSYTCGSDSSIEGSAPG